MIFDAYFYDDLCKQIDERNVVQAINNAALIDILVEKGICTHEEIIAARAKVTPIIDQLFAAKKEAAKNEP